MLPRKRQAIDGMSLKGARVLDFGWVMAAPITGLLLADMGAEVIKIETGVRLDASRRGRPILTENVAAGDEGEAPDLVPLFHNVNRGKLSLTLDLANPEARGVLQRLVALSDVTIDNFTPRARRKLGLTYSNLTQARPDLIMVSLSAAGQYGPLHDISGYAATVSSLAGVEGLVGYRGEAPIGMLSLNFSDPTCGMFGYLAVVLALWHRHRTGQGQYVDLAQIEVMASLLGEPIMDYVLNHRVAAPQGNYHPRAAPYGAYPTAEDDRWVSIAVGNDQEWQAFARVVGEPWTQEERYTTLPGRLRHRETLNQRVSAWTSQRTVAQVAEPLQRVGVAAMPVMSIHEQFADPQHQAREVYVQVEHPQVGVEPISGLAWRLSETPGRVQGPAPLLGEHNQYILGELLGLPSHQIHELEERGILA